MAKLFTLLGSLKRGRNMALASPSTSLSLARASTHLILLLCIGTTLASTLEQDDIACNVFMAPSKISGGGFGVFAARSFEKNEIVEFAPLFLPMDAPSPVLMNTVLDDYHYGYDSIHSKDLMGVVVFGTGMFFNHDRDPNLLWTTNLGRGEPTNSDPDSCGSAFFIAKRPIARGEELFSSYGLEDGGAGEVL